MSEEISPAASKRFLVDLDAIDLNRVVADRDDINRTNPQRHEMQQLTAIVYIDVESYTCVGYKDVAHDEFWVRGHMPGLPLMPGVIMLEAVAQLCSYVTQKHDLLGVEMVGFGGLEEVRFRDPVLPGDRLYVICKLDRIRRGRMIVCRFQGVVNGNIVVEGILKGIPIPVDWLKDQLAQRGIDTTAS